MEINVLLRLTGRAVYLREGFIFALLFLLRNMTSTSIEFLPTRISRRQLVPKWYIWEN